MMRSSGGSEVRSPSVYILRLASERRTVAGNGGQMGGSKRKPKEQKDVFVAENEKTNLATSAETSAEVSSETSEQADAEAQADENGFESLRSAAECQLGKRGRKIAEAMGVKAESGDLNSAKFLVSVAKDKAGKGAGKKRRGPSTAEQLAHEPPWEPPATNPEPQPLEPEVENVNE
jgi:hypothetical protein